MQDYKKAEFFFLVLIWGGKLGMIDADHACCVVDQVRYLLTV